MHVLLEIYSYFQQWKNCCLRFAPSVPQPTGHVTDVSKSRFALIFYMAFNGRRFRHEFLIGDPLPILSTNLICKSEVKRRGSQLLLSKNSVIPATAVMSQCMDNSLVLVRNHTTILWASPINRIPSNFVMKLATPKLRHLPTIQRKPRNPSCSGFATMHSCKRQRQTTDYILWQ